MSSVPDSSLSADRPTGSGDHLRDILRLAVPASVEGVVQLVFNFLAQLIVATLGATAVAAVGFSNNVTLLLIFTLGTLGSGAGILVARAHGAGDRGAVARTSGTALLLAAALTLALVAGLHAFAAPVLRTLGAPAELTEAATPFFQVALLSVPLIVLSVVAGSVLRSLEQPRVPMLATFAAAAVNVALGYALVHGAAGLPRLGLAGAAWGALGGQALRVGLLGWFLYGRRGVIAPAWSGLGAGGRVLIRELLHLSLPLAATQLAWSGGNLLYALLLARLGTAALAGVQIASTLEGIFVVASFGLVPAATALIGQAVGQRDEQLARERARAVERFGLVTGVAFGVLFALTALALPALYPGVGAQVREIALGAILINAAVQVVKVANMVRGGGVLPSGSDTRGVLIGDAVSAFAVGLPLAYLLAFGLDLGVWGVLIARVLEEIVKVAIFTWRAKRLSWGAVVAGQAALPAAAD